MDIHSMLFSQCSLRKTEEEQQSIKNICISTIQKYNSVHSESFFIFVGEGEGVGGGMQLWIQWRFKEFN